MITEQQWSALGVEAASGVRAVLREALDDAGLTSVGTLTSLLPATALPPADAVEPALAVDAAVLDVQPVTYRSGSAPDDVRVIGVAFTFLISLEQAMHDGSDDLVIRALGGIVGRLTARPIRIYVSPEIGALGALVFERMPMSLTEQAAIFSASGRPFARAALYRVRVSRGLGEPDIPSVVPWNEPRRFVVVRGGSPKLRRSVAEAIAGEATIAHVDLAQIVSPWIGETEKHVSAALAAASEAGAVLLFDEADALFSKRTDVRDAHDRYAAIIVTTGDDAVVKRLARLGADVIDAADGEPHR